MKKEEKLKIAIDFIADYLGDEKQQMPVEKVIKEVSDKPTEENVLVETKSDDNLTRAYKLMKKLEAIDMENAKINAKVKKAVNPIKEELKRVKSEHENEVIKENRTGINETKTSDGVTLDDSGSIVKVSVPTLPHLSPELKKVFDEAKPMTTEEWDELKEKTTHNDGLPSHNYPESEGPEKHSPNNID